MSSQVFISYSSDDRSYVEALAGHLRAEGLDVWFDDRIMAGHTFPRAIQTAIDECRVFIVILTPSAVRSDWVRNEVVYARGRGKPVIPLMLKRCTPPVEVAALHAENVRGGRMPSGHTIARIKSIAFGHPVPAPPPPRPPKRPSRWILVVVITSLTGVLGCCALASSVRNRLNGQSQLSATDQHSSAAATTSQDAAPATPFFENYEIKIPWGTCSRWTVVDLDGDELGTGVPGQRPHVRLLPDTTVLLGPRNGREFYVTNCLSHGFRVSGDLSTEATRETSREECATLVATQPSDGHFEAHDTISVCVYTDLGNLARMDIIDLGSDDDPNYTALVTLWPATRA